MLLRILATGAAVLVLVMRAGGVARAVLNALVPGQHVSHPALSRAVELWRAFSAAPVSRQLTLSEISALGENELVMIFNELPYETRWGRAD